MRKMTGREVRDTWIKFFEKRGHLYIPGVGLIPEGDKSLLWVNAGVTGLKKYFDGSEIPPSRRIVNVQKSIRTNDIENVGHTARHHTFFEMLGNFSIGDYFRQEVILWAFEILTSETEGFGLDKERIYVTYNPADLATRERWIEIGLPSSHLIPLEGNYWQIGEGPCGPNTEVFYDRGEIYDPEKKGISMLENDEENDRYVEIWGIVFSQYNAVNGVKREDYEELPSKNIDTGAGLERITCVLQETPTNFETDLFMPLIRKTVELSKHPYEGDLRPFRVIADHARCLAFALSDGARFSNEGRGYVLRRIIRRAMRYGRKIGLERPFVHELIGVVVSEYGTFYPNLRKREETIVEDVREEEERFIKTLAAGEEMLKGFLERKESISGQTAFKLYDTYGFPIDLTIELAKEEGLEVDLAGFEKEMDIQRQKARSARGEIESFGKQSEDLLSFKEKGEFSYEETKIESEVIGLFVDGKAVSSLKEGEKGEIALRLTPFYTEKGGQVSDKGTISSATFGFSVSAMREAPHLQPLHFGRVTKGEVRIGDKVIAIIDEQRRKRIERNHSATHLLHKALSEVLGLHVEQMGSFVNDSYLRFDFSSKRKLTSEELAKVENRVNSFIFHGLRRKTEVLPLEKAKTLGAEMEFEGKYGDFVRVVSFGDYSLEFCGGTHVDDASSISLFSIVSEEAVASGVRRIVAVTGETAYERVSNRLALLNAVERSFESGDQTLEKRLEALVGDKEALRKENLSLKAKLSSLEAASLDNDIDSVNGVSYLLLVKDGVKRSDLLSIADDLKSKHPDHLFAFVGEEGEKRPIIVSVKGKALALAQAGPLLKSLTSALGGAGGGSPTMAQGTIGSTEGLDGLLRKALNGNG